MSEALNERFDLGIGRVARRNLHEDGLTSELVFDRHNVGMKCGFGHVFPPY